jgi:hypothetical protein
MQWQFNFNCCHESRSISLQDMKIQLRKQLKKKLKKQYPAAYDGLNLKSNHTRLTICAVGAAKVMRKV